MSISTVQNALINAMQTNAALDAAFATALTGTAVSSSTIVTGTDTLFLSSVKIGDYVGTPASGYRKVTAVTDNTNLTVVSAFDVALSGAIKVTQIRRGMPKNLNLTEVGRTLRVAFISAGETDDNCPNTKVRAIYGFLIVIGFYEPDEDEAESRKSQYDKLVKDLIDADPTLGGTVIGTTEAGQIKFAEAGDVEGVYYGVMPLVCERKETRGNR